MQKFISILLEPFRKHFLFFIVFFLLLTSIHIYSKINIYSFNLNPAIIMTMHGLSLSYIITLLVCFIRPKIARQIAQAILLFFVATGFAINYYCLCQLHGLFDADLAQLIIETNPNEVSEFITTMLPKRVVLDVAGMFLLLAFIWWLLKSHNWIINLKHKAALLALGAIGICIACNLYKWNIWKDGPLSLIYQLSQYDMPSDLESYYSHPQFVFEDQHGRPVNVVVIIGESFSRSHSSLYGYDKSTNPELAELSKDSLLFALDSIDSPAHSTTRSIKDMFSTFNLSDSIYDKEWYEYPSLIEIMKESNYKCYWFENQEYTGVHGACSRIYAQACDRQWFLQHTGSKNIGGRIYDNTLVDSSYQFVDQIQQNNHNFFIFHMMGSHFDYSMRYPKEFSKFTPNDYLSEPESHRQILSSYDNSILYNDYIVKEIIDIFKKRESVIVYLSDHGQVMYRNKNNPDYFAHGIPILDDPFNYAYGVDIPFFIYTSPSFQEHFPQIMERIKNRQDNPKCWNSEDLPYFIMDLIGVKEFNGEDVRSRSVL